MPSDNQQTSEAAWEESFFQQVIPNISQQLFYPSLATIPLCRRVINDIEEHQRRVLCSNVEGANRDTNTFPVSNPGEQEEGITIPNRGPQARITPAETQEETLQLESLEIEDTSIKQVSPMQDQDSEILQAQNIGETEVPDTQDTSDTQIPNDGTDSQLNGEEGDPDILDNQTSKALQDDNYHTAIDDDEQDDTIQFGNPVTQPFLSRSFRVPITEVGCLSFMQMLQDYLHAYLSPSQVDAYSQVQEMAQ